MIHDGYGFIAAGSNWGLTLYPAMAIMIAVFAFNLFGAMKQTINRHLIKCFKCQHSGA